MGDINYHEMHYILQFLIMKFNKKGLKISVWNINGHISKGYDKFTDEEFKQKLESQDIFCIQETHCDLEQCLEMEQFPNPVHLIRPKAKIQLKQKKDGKKEKTGKRFGGLSIYIRENIRKGVKFINNKTKDFIWLKLDKSFFGLVDDLYICFVYYPPEYSTYLNKLSYDILELIENDIITYSQVGKILLAGDFNARTAQDLDFINMDSDKHVPTYNNYKTDSLLLSRMCKDNVVSPRGRQLLALCVSSKLRILNGRSLGDLWGAYTCYQRLGNSIVDYMLLSEELISSVIYFKVCDFHPELSDHCQLNLLLRCNCELIPKNIYPGSPMPDKYIWNDKSAVEFQTVMNSVLIQNKISDFNKKEYDSSMINSAINDFNDILLTAAEKSLKKRKTVTKQKRKKVKDKPWQDDDLKKTKRDLDHKLILMQKYSKDPIVRGNFFKQLKCYRKLRKLKIRSFKNNLINKLEELHEENPKAYWALLDQLKYDEKKNKRDETHVNTETWYEYFKDLNSDKTPNEDKLRIAEKLNVLEKETIFNELDYTITKNEISKAIKSLKNSKATGLSQISNEMIKYSQCHILPSVHKLFNLIFSQGIYPESWGVSYINPLHKSGTKTDPANFRGISIGDNLGKLFNQVLNNRLSKFLADRNLIRPEQTGFIEGCRTSDHMFVLKTLLQKYVLGESKPLYCCFVDFKKAFDSVSHAHLLYKLKKYGIGSKFYTILKSMYTISNSCVKINNVRTNFFHCEVGVRQGDNLSPNLFNMFVNDLPSYFDASCEPLNLYSKSINCLLYADDVVLLSSSAAGLQKCLDKLDNFTNDWRMTVNLKKTKVLVFNKSGRKSNIEFKYKNEVIENVQTYKYLGIIFSSSGTFSYAKEDLYKKGFKAYFKIRRSFHNVTPNAKILMHIFNHTIRPILLYGSEVWGAFTSNNTEKFIKKEIDSLILEKLHTKFCKYSLGVRVRTSNDGSRGELGSLPILYYILINIIKYWCHLSKNITSNDSLVFEAYKLSQKMAEENKDSWVGCVKEIFSYLKLENLFNDQSKYKTNYIISQVKLNLRSKFINIWNTNINQDQGKSGKGRNKLRTFRTFKNNFSFEPYLLIGKREQKRSLSKFRLSDHTLEIERGRYLNIDEDKRICKLCSESVENEFHFLMKCKSLSSVRDIYMENLCKNFKNFKNLSSENRFIWLLSSEDKDIIMNIYKLVSGLNTKRDELLKSLTLSVD